MAFSLDNTARHRISADETGNSTKVLLGASATYTGVWEDVESYTTVAVAIFGSNVTDGTLWIESSQDGGTTVNSVPFPVGDASFALPAIWNIVESHIRIKYVNGTTPQTTYFQLQTKYSNGQELGLLQNAGDTITDDTDVQITKAISTATDPNGNYINGKVTGIGFSTTANLASGAAYVSPVIDARNYNQVQTHITSSHDGTMEFDFYTDLAGTDLIRSLSIPYTAANGFQLLSAPAFSDFIKYTFTNAVGATTTDFLYETKLLIGALSGQVLALNAFVAPSMVANLGRNVGVGLRPDGIFTNIPTDGTVFDTDTNIGSSASYVSSWYESAGYNTIELFFRSDVISADRGIKIEFSHELISPVIEETKYFTFAQADIDRGYLTVNIQPQLEAFRITYINGVTAQTDFLLHCDLKTNGNINRYNDGGGLVTGDFNTEVALENVPNYSKGEKYGVVSLLDNADGEATVWNLANDGLTPLRIARKTFNTSAVQMWIASSSASDTTKDITITYNDSANKFREVTVTLNGTTPVDCGVTAYDVASAHISSADDTLIGKVYIQQTNNFTAGVPDTASNVMAYIDPDYGRTQQACIRVPSDKKMIINNIFIQLQREGGVAGAGRAHLRIKESGGSWNTIRPFSTGTSATIDKSEEIVISPGTFVEFYVHNVSDTDSNTVCIFSYTLVAI